MSERSQLTFTNISRPWQAEKVYRCPCCRYKTLHSRGGYEICPVCFWKTTGRTTMTRTKFGVDLIALLVLQAPAMILRDLQLQKSRGCHTSGRQLPKKCEKH